MLQNYFRCHLWSGFEKGTTYIWNVLSAAGEKPYRLKPPSILGPHHHLGLLRAQQSSGVFPVPHSPFFTISISNLLTLLSLKLPLPHPHSEQTQTHRSHQKGASTSKWAPNLSFSLHRFLVISWVYIHPFPSTYALSPTPATSRNHTFFLLCLSFSSPHTPSLQH